jgi:fatty-acyl-CoA synthase
MPLRWNLADIFELVADTVPDQLALAHGRDGVTRSWVEVERRTNALARHLASRHQPGDKLAIYSYNRPEYVESVIAALKARLAPVNVNYRYREEELLYLFDNADATAVVYEAAFAPLVAALRDRLPRVRDWIELDDGSPGNAFARSYEELAGGNAQRLAIQRSPDDLLLLYTGGTTGMPKGVMWTQANVFEALGGGGIPAVGLPPSASLDDHRARIAGATAPLRLLPACPLMHGTGLFTALNALTAGGAIVTCDARTFDPDDLFATIAARGISAVAIVGDAFAKPMLRALDAAPGRHDLSQLKLIVSSGVMWSPPVKQGLLRHVPGAVLMDSFGSSEAVGFGTELTTKDSNVRLGQFRLGPNCKVFTEDGREVTPGSGEVGFVARSGPIPEGYYKDPKKSAETFREIQGRRWSIPGDWCSVNADGTLELHGRGSVCINSGGEKIFPEEVEESLKLHPAVADAVVVGVPDERWGEAVTALVQLQPGARAEESALRDFVKQKLAPYKAPKSIVLVESVGRSPSGKVDYKAAKQRVREALSVP